MSAAEGDPKGARGAVAWMAQNPVAANLLMAVLIVGGLVMSQRIKQEVFPEFELDIINVQVPFHGATPDEVEQGVVLAVEEAVRGIDGVKRVTSTARGNVGAVTVELLLGTDSDKALADIKNAVDRISSFPADAERPIVSLVNNRNEVISLMLYGDLDEKTLRALAERHRDGLLQDPGVTQVELAGTRPLEIGVEVPQQELRAHGLTLEQIAGRIRLASVELGGGGLKTAGGEVLLRTDERRRGGLQFQDVRILSAPDGTELRLADVAEVKDGFQDNDAETYFNAKRAIRLRIFRVGDQTPISVADAVKGYLAQNEASLPPGVSFAIWSDRSEIYRDRINLLLKNAFFGLILVFVSLGLFLQFRLAFWVTMGIPISFLGAMLFMPMMNVSINMISLFAFIVTLGMVVDDAIVVGENVYTLRQQGVSFMDAAIEGSKEVAVPVTFSILTTVAAFMPMFFVPGAMGKIFAVIPAIVVSVLLISLFESLFILPAHLGHNAVEATTGPMGFFNRNQARISKGLEDFIEIRFQPVVALAVRWRYVTIAASLAILIATIGLVAGGRIQFSFFPKIDGDVITASVRLPVGAPIEDARAIQRRLEATAAEALEPHGGQAVVRGLLTQLGEPIPGTGPGASAGGANGTHIIDMSVFLIAPDDRDFTASQLADAWRKRFGDVPGVDSLAFKYNFGPSAGAPINIQLSHYDTEILERASTRLSTALRDYAGVIDIEDGFADGKPEITFNLKPEARALGLTEQDLGRQLRAAFFGVEALRQQRGRDEVRVMVRLPKDERRSEQAIDDLLLRTPRGGEIPLLVAAEATSGRSATEIKRSEGRRVVNVTADLEEGVANANEVVASIQANVMPGLVQDYPGLRFSLEGEQREQADALGSLRTGALIALLAIFALLAIPFRSYIQPLIIMSAIPFGLVGAILGHLLLNLELSLMSIMGLVALTGIVVNDSLVLIVFVNQQRALGMNILDAVRRGVVERFRPIMLTSLTTFVGLAPMVLETSVQARFLIPMAVSLAFGVLFSTLIILVLVPSLYVALEDLIALITRKKDHLTLTADTLSDGDDLPTGVQDSRL